MIITTFSSSVAAQRQHRFLPVLPAGAGSCRGSSLSGVCPKRSGGTRRPQAVAPLTASFRGGRIARRGRTARPLWQARSPGVRDGGDRLAAGAGGTALRRRPAPCVPNAKAAGRAAAHQRRDSPPAQPPTAGTPPVQRLPSVNPAPMPGARPGPTGLARRRRALEDVWKVLTVWDVSDVSDESDSYRRSAAAPVPSEV